jgi:hypothetical protein
MSWTAQECVHGNCLGLKEFGFREWNAPITEREPFGTSTAIDGVITSFLRLATAAMKVG